jgi:hypothetical protein
MGRPSILTDSLIEDFCSRFRVSRSIETTIKMAGIGRASYYRWARLVREGKGTQLQQRFIRAVSKVEGEIKMHVEITLNKWSSKAWRSCAWWLERKYPNEYGRRRPPPLEDDFTDQPMPERIIWKNAPRAERIRVEPVTPIAKTTDASAPLGDPDDFTEQPRPKRVISKKARRAERIRVEPIAPIAKATEASAAGPLENVERISVTWVPSSYYQKLGLPPIIGRLLTKDDDAPDAPLVGVITDRYWEVCLGRDPKVIGQSLRIEDTAVTIVGVIPFKTPTSAKSLMADLTMAIGTRSKVTLGGGTFKLGSNFRIINVILPMRV